ncbi:fibronectin type III domain-containing protein [Actinoplanes sp. NPDC049118]|uniref:fibronectin type III domain-containing protein n=1 Tax=Actinoplanes sp. NPDC049118 TaxID=3155769 RepID=UPI00340B3CB9
MRLEVGVTRRVRNRAALSVLAVTALLMPPAESAAAPGSRPPSPAQVAAARAEALSGTGSAQAAETWESPLGGSLVAVGDEHTCSVTIAGEIWCWGAAGDGQLGVGTGPDRDRPVRVTGQAVFRPGDDTPPGAIQATDIDAGGAHTCAVVNNSYHLFTDHGTVYCWGANDRGQLGDGTLTTRGRPVAVLEEADEVAAGRRHTCALTGAGTVSCWGSNDAGQLGIGTVGGHRDTPQAVPGLTDVVTVGAGHDNTCAVTENGRAWCWGADDHGQIGDGSGPGAPVPSPTLVDTSGVPGEIRQIDVGRGHGCAIADAESGGRAWCWGSGGAGQLGAGGTGGDEPKPVMVRGSELFFQIATGGDSTCATNYSPDVIIIGDFTPGVYCWGDNSAGRLGVGDRANRSVPARVADGEFEASVSPAAFFGYRHPMPAYVSVGAGHTCTADIDAAVYCWGTNDAGQFGNRGNQDSDVPAKTWLGPGPATALRVRAGDASLRVSWRPPADTGAAPVDYYQINADSRSHGRGESQTTTTTVLGDLTNGDAYTVLVSTLTLAGYSYSAERTATPRAASRPGRGGGLPVTGTAPMTLAATGIALLLLGVAGLTAGRRAPRTSTPD